MKKNLFVFLSLAAITAAASTAAYAATDPYAAAGTGITGSRHDINAFASKVGLGNAVVGDIQERVCAFCHTPHHAYTRDMAGASRADYLPLWSHELNNSAFTAYGSDTLQARLYNGDPLVGPSRLCMSCHDGVIAVDTHYTNLGEVPTGAELTGDLFSPDPRLSGAVGKNNSLAGDHPIGFDYVTAQQNDQANTLTLTPGIRLAASQFRKVNGQGGVVYTGIKIEDVLYPNPLERGEKRIMTCSSCHEVHNRDNVVQVDHAGASLGVNYFLYGSQSGSQICLSCHDK